MVTVVTCTKRPGLIENIFTNYKIQNLANKELIIVINHDDVDWDLWNLYAEQTNNVQIFKLGSRCTLGECLNFAIEKATHDYIAKFDDDDYYAPEYLNEAMEAAGQTNADLIGKKSMYSYVESNDLLAIYSPGNEKVHTYTVSGSTFVFKKETWEKHRFHEDRYGLGDEDYIFAKELFENGYSIFSTSKKNHLYIRLADPNHHTWKISDDLFLLDCRVIDSKVNIKTYITQ
jgi:glycosyltransferase involved in cell wall biosynthesis